MTKLLWISYCAAYMQVPHAGGKNHYYWLKKLQEDSSFDIKLITCCELEEYDKFCEMRYPFEYHCCISYNSVFGKMWQKMQSIIFAPYSLFCFAGSIAMHKIIFIKKWVRKLKKQGYVPDTILLQWTQIGLLYAWIQKQFPNTKLVVMEEDVSFLRTQREYLASTGITKVWRNWIHRVMFARELEMCRAVDSIITTNGKDKEILKEHGINESKILYAVSYYGDLSSLVPKRNSLKILFYGAMNRKENIDAVVWFAKFVLPKLRERDSFEFVVLGGNPDNEVRKLENSAVIITGYVDDIRPYFEDALCLVVPLFGGAGIKIKVLEGMSSGIPVLTNEIGIEGIMAIEGEDYFKCDTVEDYVAAIMRLVKEPTLAEKIGKNGQTLVKSRFNTEGSVAHFKEVLYVESK